MAALSEDLFFATIAELSQKLRARQVSAVELTRGFGERLQTRGPGLNALALPLVQQALKTAKAVDADLKRERWRGPLQGVPYGAQDLLSVAKQPTTWGAKPYAAQTFDYDATVITKLNKTGALLLGKLAVIELAGAGGYHTASASLFGPCLNPWDRSRWAGGSSSGSAAAVAAGLAPYAIGSETSGSILTPAAFCGVTALRPTYGLVSRHGSMPLSWTMDKLGPFCRSAEDCAFVLETLAGGDPNDPGSAGKSFYYTPQYARQFSDLTLGIAAVDFEQLPDPPIRPILQQALSVLRDCGLKTQEMKLPNFPYSALASTIVGAEGASALEELIASGRVDQLADPTQAAGLRANSEIPAKDYLRAMRIRTLIKAEFHNVFSTIDALVAPVSYSAAPKISERLDDSFSGARPDDRGMGALIPASNLAGIPALCLPCGFVEGLPVALQIVGPAFSENTLIAIGKAFQQRTDFHRKHPSSAL